MLALCETENATKIDELLQAGGTKEHGNMLKRIQVLQDDWIPAKEARNWKIEGQKTRITRKEYIILRNEFEMRGFMAQKGLWNVARVKCCRTEMHWLRKKETLSDSTRPCMKIIS